MKDQVEAFAIWGGGGGGRRRGSRERIEPLTGYDMEIYMKVQDIIGSDRPSQTPNPCFFDSLLTNFVRLVNLLRVTVWRLTL